MKKRYFLLVPLLFNVCFDFVVDKIYMRYAVLTYQKGDFKYEKM